MKIFFRIVAVFLGFVLVIAAADITFLLMTEATEKYARILPAYERESLDEVLAKESWSEEDYDLLYHQTGLTQAPLDALKGDSEAILEFQDALFYDGEWQHSMASVITPHEYMIGYSAPIAPLEDGDILVSSTCHTLGWRNGHAAIVVDAEKGVILESVSLGYDSALNGYSWFTSAANFMVLRLKDVSQEKRAEIAAYAKEHMVGLPYSLTVGLFSKKDLSENIAAGDLTVGTQCGHLVWQAYYNFGYDLDSNGGPVVVPKDIATSPLLEVVQVYGFDPDRLWFYF